jgi:hypothetical protein
MRPLGSQPAITDGPFAETKETVGGSLRPRPPGRARLGDAMSAAAKRLRKIDPPAAAAPPAEERLRRVRRTRIDEDVCR